MGLDRVVLMPAREAPHKMIDQDPGAEERYLMCELVASGAEWLDASRIEVDRPGPSYTADTLRQLAAERPGDEIVLVLGGDRAVSLPQWHEPAEVVRLATLAVARRNGVGEGQVREALAGLADGDRVRFFDMPAIEVSSSAIRDRIAEGLPFEFLLPERVAHRIAEAGLYRGVAG